MRPRRESGDPLHSGIGGAVYGLAAALKGEITIDKGRVQQSNFNNYDVLRMDEMPEFEVFIVPSTEAPGGMGEASTRPRLQRS